MAAKTNWWYCAKCGFQNKPHNFRKDNTRCEQCGESREADEAVDYKPEGA